jgi:hypothetical protein
MQNSRRRALLMPATMSGSSPRLPWYSMPGRDDLRKVLRYAADAARKRELPLTTP